MSFWFGVAFGFFAMYLFHRYLEACTYRALRAIIVLMEEHQPIMALRNLRILAKVMSENKPEE